jgi:hypothetical protein
MSKTLTLDEILADLYEHTGDKDLDPEWISVVQYNNKQAILQWVATVVVGENTYSVRPSGGSSSWKAQDELRAEQRQTLKDHGWKKSV